jgi:thiamine pyrophosphokinase
VAHRAVVVVVGGGLPAPRLLAHVPTGVPIVAADSGLDSALALGMRADVVVGDLDSVTPGALAIAEAAGARVARHPVDKDETDLALALHEAEDLLGGRGQVVVVGGVEGRLDHLLAGVLALADTRWAALEVRAVVGDALVHVLHGPAERELDGGERGDLVSLLPAGGPANGVRTRGLRFPLVGEVLHAGTTRGVSNVVDDPPAAVALDEGALLAIIEGGP